MLSKTKSTIFYVKQLCTLGQSIENLHISEHNYLKNLDFVDKCTPDYFEKFINILIGMDYYFHFVADESKRP